MSSVIEYKDEARICPSFLEHRPQSKALKAYLSLQSKICFAQRRPWNQCSRLLMTSIEITAQGHQWWSHKYWWQYISASLRGRKVHHTSYNHILKCESLFFLNEKIELNLFHLWIYSGWVRMILLSYNKYWHEWCSRKKELRSRTVKRSHLPQSWWLLLKDRHLSCKQIDIPCGE